ncbi:MAG: response regulator [Rectinemataceae bacterium]|nr:response regulator [Rectinemataceae bacterium]
MTRTIRSAAERGRAFWKAFPLPFLFTLIVVTAFLAFSAKVNDSEQDICGAVAFRASEDIAASVEKILDQGSTLKSALEVNPALGKTQIEAISLSIMRSQPLVIGVSTAPSAIVKYHFPEPGNESNIGHDLLSNPDRRDALALSVENRSAVVSGPFESVDGENVVFLRYPVFSGAKLWGFVSLTLDFGKLVDSFALRNQYPGINFAFSDGGNYFVGESLAEPAGGAFSQVKLPGANWQVHAFPEGGWTTADPFLYILLAAALTGAALLFAVFFSRARRTFQSREEAPAEVEPASFVTPTTPHNPVPVFVPEPVPERAPPRERAPVAAEPPQAIQQATLTEKRATPTPIILPMRNGKEVKFKGPAVKGQLYMPEFVFEDEGLVEPPPETKPEPRPEPQPEPRPEPKPEPRLPTFEKPPRPKPVELRKQEFLFSIEEEKPKAAMLILVVDDSAANRDIMGRMLSLRGYKADFAASGEEALALCAPTRYAVIFMDCFMPDMDGYKAASLLRSAHPGMGAKIVGMSARVGAQELERCRQSGMDYLMAKPFTLKDLLSHIEKS